MTKKLPWCDVIPENWTVCKSHFALKYKHQAVKDGDEIITVFRDGEATLRRNRREEGFTNAEKEVGYQHVDAGDLLIHSMDGGFGAIGVSDSSGKASPVVHAYSSDKCDLRFVAYQLRSAVGAGWVAALGKGIRIRSTQFDRPAFASMEIAFPSLETQRRIADYLDRETAEIDKMVAALDDYVKLLEKRHRVFVADKLNLGMFEEQRSRVGFVAKFVRRGISPSYVDHGIAVLGQRCVRSDRTLDTEQVRFHDETGQPVPSQLRLKVGDTLVNSTGTGTLGRTGFIRKEGENSTWDSHVTVVRPDDAKVDPEYLSWAIHAREDEIIRLSEGSTNQIELSRDTLLNLSIFLPSRRTQKHLVNELNAATVAKNSIVQECTELRDLLLTRRQVLISDVVSGRKEV